MNSSSVETKIYNTPMTLLEDLIVINLIGNELYSFNLSYTHFGIINKVGKKLRFCSIDKSHKYFSIAHGFTTSSLSKFHAKEALYRCTIRV